MNQANPWLRIGTLFTTIAVVLVLLALAGGLPAATRTASAQTVPTDRPRPTATATPQGTIVGGGGADLTPTPSTTTGTPGPVGTPTPITSGEGGGGGCQIFVTVDDGIAPGTIQVIEVPIADLQNRDNRFTYIRACEVIYRDGSGTIVPNKTFSGPLESCFVLTPEDLARAGGNPERLTILYYDTVSGTWQELAVIVDPTNGRICAQQSISGILALALKGGSTTLPGTSGQIPEGQAGAPAAGAAPAPGAAPAAAEGNAAASAPATESNSSAAAPAVAAAPAAAPAAAAAAAPATPTSTNIGAVLVLILGVAAAVFAVILVLSRNMLSRSGDK